MCSMVIGEILATTKTKSDAVEEQTMVFLLHQIVMFVHSMPSNIDGIEKREGAEYFAPNVQCANKCIGIDKHLLVAKLFNVMVKPLTVSAFSEMKFIGIFAAVSVSIYLFWNLMHIVWSTAPITLSLSISFFLEFFHSIFTSVCVFFVCSDFNFNPKLNWMCKIDARARQTLHEMLVCCKWMQNYRFCSVYIERAEMSKMLRKWTKKEFCNFDANDRSCEQTVAFTQ